MTHTTHANRRAWIGLGTSNKTEAAALALKFYQEIRANGWDDTLRRRRAIRMGGKGINVTIGEYLDAVNAKSAIYSKTIEGYAVALRKIAADIHRITHNGKRLPRWRAQVDYNQARDLTAEKIETWRVEFIKRGSINPLKEKSARVSANSFIRRARSFFGAEPSPGSGT